MSFDCWMVDLQFMGWTSKRRVVLVCGSFWLPNRPSLLWGSLELGTPKSSNLYHYYKEPPENGWFHWFWGRYSTRVNQPLIFAARSGSWRQCAPCWTTGLPWMWLDARSPGLERSVTDPFGRPCCSGVDVNLQGTCWLVTLSWNGKQDWSNHGSVHQ